MPSFSFGGVKKPYIESVFGGRKRQVYNLKRNFLYVPGRPGAYFESTDIDVKVIEEEVILIAQDREDLQKIKEDLAAWLITDEPKELIFDDEPDRVYYALVDGTFDPDDFVNLGSGTITFVVPDGCKYGPSARKRSPPRLLRSVEIPWRTFQMERKFQRISRGLRTVEC